MVLQNPGLASRPVRNSSVKQRAPHSARSAATWQAEERRNAHAGEGFRPPTQAQSAQAELHAYPREPSNKLHLGCTSRARKRYLRQGTSLGPQGKSKSVPKAPPSRSRGGIRKIGNEIQLTHKRECQSGLALKEEVEDAFFNGPAKKRPCGSVVKPKLSDQSKALCPPNFKLRWNLPSFMLELHRDDQQAT